MASSLAEQPGCEFDEGLSGAFIRTGADKQTTVAGVYAAGDAARSGTTPPGPLPMELQRESRPTDHLLCVSPYVALELRRINLYETKASDV